MRVAVLFGIVGCSALPVSAAIRNPIDSKCQSYGLKGCSDLVDGAIAYTEGDKARGTEKLNSARAQNTPEQLRKFAASLHAIASATESARPLDEVATILAGGASTAIAQPAVVVDPKRESEAAAATSVADEKRATAQRLAIYALTAHDDPSRRTTETVELSVSPGLPCQIAGSPALCGRRKQGPVTVTDVVASEECGQRAFLVAADSDTPSFGLVWMLPARTQGIHGANFTVKGGDWLFVAMKSAPKQTGAAERGCFLTWSGFQPRLAPPAPVDAANDYTANPYK